MKTPEAVRKYVVDGIAGTPVVLGAVLGRIGAADPVWDARPDPDRFTLREVVAHLADWDDVFIGRVVRIRDEDHPMLENADEGRMCQERDYSAQDGMANLKRLCESRPKLVSLLRALPDEAWERTGHREFVGDVTMAQLASMILGHDAYHLRQAVEYTASA